MSFQWGYVVWYQGIMRITRILLHLLEGSVVHYQKQLLHSELQNITVRCVTILKLRPKLQHKHPQSHIEVLEHGIITFL